MIKMSHSKFLVVLTKLLLLLGFAKVISLGMWWYLPSDGVELNVKKNYEPKYQRVDFTNMIAPSKEKQKNSSLNANNISGSGSINITNMVLKGLYASYEDGYAIVALKSEPKKTSIIAIGEIYQGYTLKSVELSNVIFEKDSKEFILELEKIGKDLSSLPPQNSENSVSKVSREDMNFFAKDPQAIWKDISIVEVKDGDKIAGFKVTKINPKSKFAALGLLENDVIIKLNNVLLQSYKDAIELYKDIDKIETIQIVVIRENQEKELIYEIH